MSFFVGIVFCVFLGTPAYAQEHVSAHQYSHHKFLSSVQIERVRVFKALIADVDSKSIEQTISDIEKADYPAIQLQMREAMAKTYVDLAREQNVTGQNKKDWLYSMVTLNMAYLQFGGAPKSADGSLNKLICSKLKGYLPDILNRPGFHFSLE